ncbi:hypothetical protein VLY81_07050 [Geochorda subterranea]|uniref:Uncharacterized protein n=1 Tax=Geochorda subterranea TaxID=3109564 RepID=A0ABZ1BTF5_9FIRM|nr:hypothetical protein [Limnochorda sp. LNt]WRP15900.1 hypothetical protein VLY81_07050 [Limnochorda sp. LNt]
MRPLTEATSVITAVDGAWTDASSATSATDSAGTASTTISASRTASARLPAISSTAPRSAACCAATGSRS